MNQPEQETQDDLMTCVTSLLCISECTDDDFLTPWHQSLQQNIQDLMKTSNLLQQQSNVTPVQQNKAYLRGLA